MLGMVYHFYAAHQKHTLLVLKRARESYFEYRDCLARNGQRKYLNNLDKTDPSEIERTAQHTNNYTGLQIGVNIIIIKKTLSPKHML